MRRPLELGASVNLRGTFGGPTHGVGTTALHHAAEAGRLAVIEILLAAGADPTSTDDLHGGTSWADHGGREGARQLLLG